MSVGDVEFVSFGIEWPWPIRTPRGQRYLDQRLVRGGLGLFDHAGNQSAWRELG